MLAISRAAPAAALRTTAAAANPTLREGAKGSSVLSLQNKLKAAGFNPGAADGSFGPKTTAAVKAFQKARGLTADGVVGPKTWTALNAAGASSGGSGPTMREGAKGEPVRALQNRLNQLGFNAGTADGSFGPKTTAAVKAFQQSRGLTADGVVGPKTWDKLGIKVGGSVSTPPATGGGRAVTGYVNGVPRQITLNSIPNGKEMRSDAAASFNRMHAAAARAGVTRVLGLSTAFNGRRLCEGSVGLLEEKGLSSWRAAGAVAPQDPNAPRANALDRDPRSGGITR